MSDSTKPELRVEEVIPAAVIEEPATGPTIQQAKTGVLEMTLTGEISLQLRYASGGQSAYISFEEGALRIELEDGAEFRIPFKPQARSQAA